MFIIGVLLHLCFLFSIFDIYFKSPIVRNVESYKPQHSAPADRLVLFIVDGLRAESFVNYTTMKYLRSVANTHGRWGISNTQVPTESRPGHVAIIAGFYEDPSAVAKGWKENPVDFDSVFNQSSYTWCWGAYDIVNIFAKRNMSHISINEFDPYDNNFSTDKNTTLLDAWVFEKVNSFFYNAKNDDKLMDILHEKKIIFFLHLLGTDTAGHTYKPKTMNFLTTLTHVDEGIKKVEKEIRDFYHDDGRTTFLMTSDHGMTDWGSHGAGDNHETETPYVLWGSSVQQTKQMNIDPETVEMSLEHRVDIRQADLTPLMSTILSIPVPVNSIGKLNSDLLNMTLMDKAKAIYSNSRQLALQYNKKRHDVESNAIPLLYKAYEPFNKNKYQELLYFTEKLLHEEDYERLILFSEEIIHLSLSGLKYYHDYYQRTLLCLVTLSFLGWISCLLKLLIQQTVRSNMETPHQRSRNPLSNICFHLVFSIKFIILFYIVYAQHLPVQYYIYFLMPVLLWWYNLSSFPIWKQAFMQIKKNNNMLVLCLEVLCCIFGCIAMAASFSARWKLSIPLMGMAMWPFMGLSHTYLSKPLLFLWCIGCFLLSLFSFIPVVGKNVFIELVIGAGLLWLLAIGIYVINILLPLYNKGKETLKEIIMTVIHLFLLILSLHNIYVQSQRFENGTRVSYFYQLLSWVTSVISMILPLAFSKRIICRLLAINTSSLIIYLLLSVSHEGLFMVVLISNVVCWIIIEFQLLHVKQIKLVECMFNDGCHHEASSIIPIERSISRQDFRRAFFFILYIILAFFGTGNIASLNSFEIRWVTCFITSYKPFIITALILFKTLLPFIIVACCFKAIQFLTQAPIGYLNIIVLIYSNFMGIQLLYYVKNTGSWLEIGTSISQFVIVQVITLFIMLINHIAKLLTHVSLVSIASKVFKSRKKYV